MLHGAHTIFPPPSIAKHTGPDPIAEAKLKKGNGTWENSKETLGWQFNGETGTIQLPSNKTDTVCKLICKLLKREHITLQKFQQITGKLQHASLGIPGRKSLFTLFDVAMAGDPKVVNLNPTVKQALEGWRYLIQCLNKHPTLAFQLQVQIHWILRCVQIGNGRGVVQWHD